jgi:hypothetical protein
VFSGLGFAENCKNVSPTVKNPDDSQRITLGIIHDDEIGKSLNCPKAEWKLG